MATHTGDEGIVKIGSTAVGEVTSFSFTLISGVIEDTAKGDTAVTRKAGRADANGTVSCWWDQDDAQHVLMAAGLAVTLILQVEGDTTGDFQYTIPAIVTEETHESSEGEGIATCVFSFVATGAITRDTAA